MHQITLYTLIALFFSFLCTTLASRKIIPKLRSMKMGQKILDIGPRWHKNKEGTPTMGGIVFLLTTVLLAIISCLGVYLSGGTMRNIAGFLTVAAFAVVSGAIGMLDDLVKFSKKQNQGLTAAQKFFLQLLSAAGLLAALYMQGAIHTAFPIPFFDVTIELGIFYYPIALILITGMINSVNLADGIDGLAGSETLIVSLFLICCALNENNGDVSILGALGAGCAGGFLIYNFYPARVFMGDTGSLFFGGLLIGCGFLLNNPLILIVSGLMFILETVSVILQTTYFKITKHLTGTGKRIFKMSPLHHHFEMCGWKEVKIVTVFSFFTLLFSALSFILEYMI